MKSDMKRLIFPTAAALALVANTSLAFAQEHERVSCKLRAVVLSPTDC